MKGKLLGTTIYEGIQYGLNDVNGFVETSAIGADDSFYGGRVKQLGKVDNQPILLCIERENVIDIILKDETESDTEAYSGIDDGATDVTQMDRKELIAYAKKLGVQGKLATLKTQELIDEINKVLGDCAND